MMGNIKIKRNSLGDTRTATRVPSISEFNQANNMHREDVKKMMDNMADLIKDSGISHDHTKVFEPYRSTFYRELCATIEGKMNFEEGEWYPFHCESERHHLDRSCPEDVNLLDVIEMICDCVCAGMARSGSVRPITINSELLQKAVANTVDLCKGSVILEGNEDV